MIILAFFSWWYGAGWAREARRVSNQIAGVADTFSVTVLLATLFSPFRQISAGRVNGPLDVIVRAWFDRLLSRLIGAMVRSVMIVMGVASLVAVSLYGGLRLAIWPLLPIITCLAVIAMMVGWVPSWKV